MEDDTRSTTPPPVENSIASAPPSLSAAAPKAKSQSKIDGFFKRQNPNSSSAKPSNSSSLAANPDVSISKDKPAKCARVQITEFDSTKLERDPGLRPQIWDYHVDLHDVIRRAYITAGPYQPKRLEYPKSGKSGEGVHQRGFCYSWFESFPSWLEYSPAKDAAYCLPCFLFQKPSNRFGQNAFTITGFRKWRKVKIGSECSLLKHIGTGPNSSHRTAENSCDTLMRQTPHIPHVLNKYSSQQIMENRLLLKTSVQSVRWLALQGCAFRGHDERKGSTNRGNFLEMVDILGNNNEKIAEVLAKASGNATYTSPQIQKEILHVLSTKVKRYIREEIGDAKFCVIVDESRDESKREQMSIVLRFVDKKGLVQERFFGLVHVTDTTAVTLKNAIYSVLSQHDLDVQNIRGQGYDGASNMRGEWNGLQALISKDCPYAYYIHCLAHRLQLALVAASREVIPIHNFFNKLVSIVNIVGASCKRNDELRKAKAAEIEHLISIDELETGRGLNQIGTIKRAGDTRWSSHFKSITSLIDMFSPTCEVLINIIDDGTTYVQRGDADAAYESMTCFDFVFTLHLMKSIMEITDFLCQSLQNQSQDILNAMQCVSSTKLLLRKLRTDGWEKLINTVKLFCEKRSIDVPNMSDSYVARRGRARNQQNDLTIEQYYRFEIFNTAIDSQSMEISNRFSENLMELLILSSSLDPREARESFKIDKICQLVEKFYPEDFTDYDKLNLKLELQHYEQSVLKHPEFADLSTISDVCHWLVKTRQSITYPLTYRLLVLVLTLPVSTATTERSFSAMRIVKTRLRNKMEDGYLNDSLLVYIEKEIAKTFSLDSIIDDFRDIKERRILF